MRASQPGPEGQAPSPARWRWLLPLGGTAVILALLTLPQGGPQGMALSYPRFLSDVPLISPHPSGYAVPASGTPT